MRPKTISIGQRPKAAFAVAKARGRALGNAQNPLVSTSREAAATMQARAKVANSGLTSGDRLTA